MNKEKLCLLLKRFRELDVICYAYRETAFQIVSSGNADGVIYLISDVSANRMMEAMKNTGFKEITRGGETVEARFGTQSVKIRLIDGKEEKFAKTICQPLSVCSLLIRDDGSIYDKYGGCADIENKILRRTSAPVADKISLCTFCFDCTVKRGYVPDESVREEMKKTVTLPLTKKVSFLLTVKSIVKSKRFDARYLLSAFGYVGLFPNAGVISYTKQQEIEVALRKCDADEFMVFLCYLAGFKSEQLKSVPNMNGQRELYEKIMQFIKNKEPMDRIVIRSRFSEKEEKTLLTVAELIALISGEDFVGPEAGSALFRTFEASAFWKAPAQEPIKVEDTADIPDKTENDLIDIEIPDYEGDQMFGGEEEENYEVEEGERTPAEMPSFGVRSPTDNHYLRSKFK